MRAVLSTRPGGPQELAIEEIEAPRANPGEVVVKVAAVGINFADTLIIEDRYQYKPDRPFSPGGELSGVVAALGEGVMGLTVGDRICAYVCWGALREEVAIPAASCVKLPDAMPMDVGAGFMITYGSSYYALKQRGALRPGETVLVTGAAGGAGAAAIELAKAMGARVIASVSSEDKAEFCRSIGADETLIYPRAPLDGDQQKALSQEIKAIAGPAGLDIVYDAIGGDYAEPALRALNWDGRFLIVGFAAGVPAVPFNLPMLKGLDILGVFWGAWAEKFPADNAANIAEMLALYETGAIRPSISARYTLETAADALKALKERKATGKLVVEIS